jgi:hypothetical protein
MAVFLSKMSMWCLALFVLGSTGQGYGREPLLDMGKLSSAPIVADFLPRYNKMMAARDLAGASSEALALVGKHSDSRDAAIAGTYCWAFATLIDCAERPPAERTRAAVSATEALRRCLVLIEKSSSAERNERYAPLHEKLIPFELMDAACLAGSNTLVVRMAEDFFAKDPESSWCNPTAAILCESFRQIHDEDGLISCLKSLAERYKGKWGASPVLWQLARIYARKGDEAAFRSLVETMEADFPDDNIYKQALRKFAAERKIQDYDALRKTNAPKPKAASTSSTALMRNPDLASTGTCATSSCGCGCGTTTTTTATACCKP